ncbi:MAG: response regulator [Anaerolineaceae bacterium]|nr:response regulator [Anaerolineaceae bacterium]
MPKIIVIEDDGTMRSLLKTLLELEGYEVIVDAGGDLHEIIELIRQERPDALLMDVFLRSANGLEVVSSLRQFQDFNQLPVLITSGMDLGDEVLHAGADGFVQKPFMPDELTAWLKLKIG